MGFDMFFRPYVYWSRFQFAFCKFKRVFDFPKSAIHIDDLVIRFFHFTCYQYIVTVQRFFFKNSVFIDIQDRGGCKDFASFIVVFYFFHILSCAIRSSTSIVSGMCCKISGFCKCRFTFGFCFFCIFFTPEYDLFFIYLFF